jgi:membrane protein DedA with SNARE-associated domain/membrane-associated phospholipid phosphatase
MGPLADRILALHGVAVLAVVFLLPALEASAFLGVVVPGEIAVLLGGVLAFQHRVSLPAVIAAGVCGAIAGDTVGYLIGRRWGRRILHSWLGRLVKAEHLDRAERFLRQRGGPAVFLGRFTAALRALVPGLAGMAGLHYRTFALYNAAGGVVWVSGFVLLGYAAGTGWRQVEQAAGRASLLLLVVLLVVGVIVLAARWTSRRPDRIRAAADRMLQWPPVARLRARYQRQLAFLLRRLQPGGALGLSLTVTILALVGAAWAFGAVLQDTLAHDELALVDQPVMGFLLRHREAWLTTAMRVVTELGGAWVLVPLVVLAGLGWRWRTGSWRSLLLLAGAFAGAWLLQETVRLLVARPRPPITDALVHAGGLGFPSGHATDAAATYGMLAALLAGVTARWPARVAIWATAVALVGLIALSRLYLGVHWLTDALGGLTLGAAWLFGLLAAVGTIGQLHATRTASHPPPDRPPPDHPRIPANPRR